MVVSLARLTQNPLLQASREKFARHYDWCFSELAGRLVQLEGAGDSAAVTLAFTLILEAQQCGEPVVWITPSGTATGGRERAGEASVFYPPDAHESGIDLAALPVVRVPDVVAAFAAADVLVRSGGFGLIVADLDGVTGVESTSLARLAGLARRHHTALLFLTRPAAQRTRRRRGLLEPVRAVESQGSLGSLISLHVRSHRKRIGRDRFRCGLVVLKDKQRGPTWEYTEYCRGAVGLR